MNPFPILVVSAVAAALASWLGVGWLIRVAGRRWVDVPNPRSSHTRPTPRGGGLAIVAVTLLGCILAALFSDLFTSETSFSTSAASTLLSTAGLVVAVSWLDDVRSLPPLLRLGAHLLAAGLLVAVIGAGPILTVSAEHPVIIRYLAASFGLLWLVALTNVYNFMDGIDGIAGLQAGIAGLSWAFFGGWIEEPMILWLGLLIAASSFGFLLHNWPPARIFMGDVGSAFLGFCFAALALIGSTTEPRLFPAGALVVWPFLADGTFTLLRRLSKRENIFAAHRSHLYQRLVIAGKSHRFVTMLYGGLALAGGVVPAVLWVMRFAGSEITVVLLPLSLFLLLWAFTVRQERKPAAGR